MNQRQRFFRKIAYACAIAALLLPLSWLSQPAAMRTDGTQSDGGILAQMREEYHLSQATLGEIDPASETIKLATLGMRGVAANILWEKAHDYRKREDWTSLSATLEQIAKLQPNFISVWIFQGWNLSYNISVEFDDYRDRYYWVIKGVEFLKEGVKYNTKEPRLLCEVGQTIAHKIGRADEHVQYRRLFREDDDFNGSLPRAQRDNWLVGRQWMTDAERMVDQEGLPVRGMSPLLFHSHPVMCLINYGEAIEEEGTFGEVAKNAWKKAADAWTQFSNRDLPTQYNVLIHLADKEMYDQRSKHAQEELVKLAPPGLRDQVAADKLAALTEAEREAYDTHSEDLTPQQGQLMYLVNDKLRISHLDIADRITGENHAEALRWAEEATQADFYSRTINGERDIVNYDYWVERCKIEPQDNTLEARKKIYDADQAFTAAQLVKSKQLYDEGLQKWREVVDAYPLLLNDANLMDELVYSIDHYRGVLHQLDEQFPQPFVLQDVLDANEKFTGRKFIVNKSESEAADPSQPATEANETPENPAETDGASEPKT